MKQQSEAVEARIDTRARIDLMAVHERHSGVVEEDRITFTSWTPVGARKIKKRRFTALALDGRPVLVSKSALDDDDAKVAAEWHKLGRLALPATVDWAKPVEQTEDGFIMTYAASEDLPTALMGTGDRETFAALLTRTVDLVADMHLRGAVTHNDPAARWAAARQYVADPLVSSPALRAALEHALVGPTHGDLAPWNLRYDAETDRVSIIDWEDYRPLGVAGMDLLNLLVTLGLVVFPEYRERGVDWLYDQVLESDHWYALLLRDLLVRYAERTGQLPRRVVDLLPLFCQWLIARISNEGRDPSPLYYGHFIARYTASAPQWVKELPDE
ncbi:phosphotransferase [Streptomyces canus]|uniref:phosphotransferase n=1 Tax=Streptomyces canus TaxID=58343 RepID=UPI00037B5CCC|nr:phosphotransferase [Streptomyces canus]